MRYRIIFLFIILFGCSKKIVAPQSDQVGIANDIGQVITGNFVLGCSTETNEHVLVNILNGQQCGCYEKDGDTLVEIDNTTCVVGSCKDDCCTGFLNTNRGGIGDTRFFKNFIWGTVSGASWADFVSSFEFQGGSVFTYCPDVSCNVTNMQFCDLNFSNLPLTYEDEDGNRQEIITTCSSRVEAVESWCAREDIVYLDNHVFGSNPISPVAYRTDQHLITIPLSNGQIISFTDNAPYASYPAQLDDWAAILSTLTGKDWERKSRGNDGNPTTPYGNYSGAVCCPNDPYPLFGKARATTIGGPRDGRVFPILVGKIEGEVIQYEKCLVKGEESIWTQNGAIVEQPLCANTTCDFPLAILPPADEPCSIENDGPFCHVIDPANGDPATTNDIVQSGVFYEIIICDGVKSISYYTLPNPNDEPVPYVFTQGRIADCNTLDDIEIVEPQPTCEDWETVQVYRIVGENGVNVRNCVITGQTNSTTADDVFNQAPDDTGMPGLDPAVHNSASCTEKIESDLLYIDRTNGQDGQQIWTWLYTTETIQIRDRAYAADATSYYIGECGTSPVKVAECLANCLVNTSLGSLDPGIHFVGAEVFDISAFSGIRLEYSLDGTTWLNIPASWLYKNQPIIQQCSVFTCPETRLFADIVTGDAIDISEVFSCEPALCGAPSNDCINICPDPCAGFDSSLERLGLVDCTVGNQDSLYTYTCLEGVIDSSFTLIDRIEECEKFGDWKLAANNTSIGTSWVSGHYRTECPYYSNEVSKRATVNWDGKNSLFMFGMSDDLIGSWTGDLIFYVYKWTNGSTVRNWLRPYSDTGGWLSGWLDQGATATTTDICLERIGINETWIIDGTVVATSTGNTNPLYCWSSPYVLATGTWSGGTHGYTDVSICPQDCGTSVANKKSRFVELSNDQAIKILTNDGLSPKDIQLIMNPDQGSTRK